MVHVGKLKGWITMANNETELTALYVSHNECGCGGTCKGCQRIQELQGKVSQSEIERAVYAASDKIAAREMITRYTGCHGCGVAVLLCDATHDDNEGVWYCRLCAEPRTESDD